MGQKKHMEDAADWKFKRNRNGNEHITNCTTGYYKTREMQYESKTRIVAEIHHVLCVHACSDDTFPSGITEEEKLFIYKSLAITDWNINGGDNNIGLPRKWAYVIDPKNATGWDGLPCHQVDHDIYLNAVRQWVTEEIWNKIKANKKAGKCENMEATAVADLFNTGSSRWKKFLQTRGVQHGGTKANLDYCMSGNIDPAKEAVWNIPFSMAAPESNIRKRVKPPKGISLARKDLLSMVQ